MDLEEDLISDEGSVLYVAGLHESSVDNDNDSFAPISRGGSVSASGQRIQKRMKSLWVFEHILPLDSNNPESRWVCTVPLRLPSS